MLRLLGYSRWQLLGSFLLESLLIAAFGSPLGCAIGLPADGTSATSLVSNGPIGGRSVVLRLAIDTRILGAGMLLALTMGVVGGVLPSRYPRAIGTWILNAANSARYFYAGELPEDHQANGFWREDPDHVIACTGRLAT